MDIIANEIRFAKGDRVKVHPATESFKQGDVYGTVVYIKPHGRIVVHVLMDDSNKTRKFTQGLLELSS